jgi:hypothetical protein
MDPSPNANAAPAPSLLCSIPALGQIKIHPGHRSLFECATGKTNLVFVSPKDFPDFVQQAVEYCGNSRIGSKPQSLSYFLTLKNYIDGARVQATPEYDSLASAWDKYCKKRFYGENDQITAYGKSVSRTIYIGKPTRGGNYGKLPQCYPLHTCPCSICAFLTTVAKGNESGQKPYATLDLAGIHEYFSKRCVFLNPVLGDVEDEPKPAEPTSPEPTAEVIKPCLKRKKAVKEVAVTPAVSRRLTFEPEPTPTTVESGVLKTHVVGQIEW